MSKIFDCKCENCKAEFQAILENPEEVFECPSCKKDKIKRTESDVEFGCAGGCGSCGDCH